MSNLSTLSMLHQNDLLYPLMHQLVLNQSQDPSPSTSTSSSTAPMDSGSQSIPILTLRTENPTAQPAVPKKKEEWGGLRGWDEKWRKGESNRQRKRQEWWKKQQKKTAAAPMCPRYAPNP